MVYKGRLVILFIFFIIFGFLTLTLKGNVETNLLKILLPKKIINSTVIVSLADKTSSNIKVVFEETRVNDSKGTNAKIKEEFIKNLDKDYFKVIQYDTKGLISQYLKAPSNFLSPAVREQLKSKKYDEVFEKSFSSLLEPAGIQLSPLDTDPYLFLDDFLLSNRHMVFGVSEFDNKIYDFITIKIKDENGLSPDLANKKIFELIKLQKELSGNGNKIYLAGNPIHSYYTSTKSIININLICILSTLLIIFLTYYYFRTLKLLIPIALAITGGMLCGYVMTKLCFADFQIVTMMFSATLIGVGIDYSYHYFFAENINKNFIKNLLFSLISTIIPFMLLFFTGIELLKQISVFTTIGLTAICLIVIFIYPVFKRYKPQKTIKNISHKYIKNMLIGLGILSLLGFLRFEFNDSLSAFYSPSKKLIKAENLYNKVSGNDFKDNQYIVVKGNNLNDIIEKEEQIISKFDKKIFEYTSISSFIPSVKRQKENFDLVQELYKNNLNKYSDILSPMQILKLKHQKFIALEPKDLYAELFDNYMLDDKTSVIIVYGDKKFDRDNVVNIQSDIKSYLIKYRITLLKFFIPVFVLLGLILSASYGLKRGIKMLVPSLCGIFGAIGLTLLIMGELNMFSIIALYMVLGFTIDYAVFRTEGQKQTEDAILLSCTTTASAFFLLSLSGFKLLSSISLILFFGILISYLAGLILYNKD